MKILTTPTVEINGTDIVIRAKIEDGVVSEFLTRRMTCPHLNPNNPEHHRHVQVSNDLTFVFSRHAKMAFENNFLVAIAAAVEPATAFAPVFQKKSTGNFASVISETPVAFQWQISDDAYPKATKPATPPAPAVWSDIVGATAATLDEALVKSGQWTRCVATNATGKTTSKPVLKK